MDPANDYSWEYYLPSATDLEGEGTDPGSFQVVFQGAVFGPGDSFGPASPCHMREFLDAYRRQTGQPVVDRSPGFEERLKQACPRYGTGGEGGPGTGNGGALGDAPPSDAPPNTGESPASLGAPDPGVPGVLVEPPLVPGEPTLVPPSEQLVYADDPQSEDDVADRLFGDGVPGDQIELRLRQARRGEDPGKPHFQRSADEEQESVPFADPVDLFSGEYLYRSVDLELPGGGFPFRLVRTYRSGRLFYGPLGYGWDHGYNVRLRLLDEGGVAIRGGFLHEDVYRLGENGSFQTPLRVYALLERNALTAGYTLSHRGGGRWVFEPTRDWPFGDSLPLTRIEDPDGNALQLRYEADRLTRIIDTVGREIVFSYDGGGLLVAVTDPTGRTVRYDYEPYDEHLISSTTPSTDAFPAGLTTSYEYANDAEHPALRHNLRRLIDPSGIETVLNEYGDDPASGGFNRVIRQYFHGNIFDYTYTRLQTVAPGPDTMDLPVLRVEIAGSCTPYEVYTFNARGNLLDHRFRLAADGSYRVCASRYGYTAAGELAEALRPGGRAIRYRYDGEHLDPRARGNLLEVALGASQESFLADRVVATLSYEDRYQRVRTMTDERGAVTTFTYDYETDPTGAGGGHPVRVDHPSATRPDGSVQQAVELHQYDEYGQVTRSTSAAGLVTEYEYLASGSAAGALARITVDPAGLARTMRFNYDRWGHVIERLDGLGNSTHYAWDGLDQLLSITAPEVDGSTARRVFQYDAKGRLVAEELPRGGLAEGQTTGDTIRHEYEYDVNGRIVRAALATNTPAAQTWRYKRDTQGRIVQLTDPVGQATAYRYDERGFLLEATALWGTDQAATRSLAYDLDGNLEEMVEGDTVTSFAFDSWGRLETIESPGPDGKEATALSITYGPGELLATVTIEGASGAAGARALLHRETWGYDERGRMVRATAGARSDVFEYDADGRVLRIVRSRGEVFAFTYDATGLPSAQTDPLGNQVIWGYDPAGNLERVELDDVFPDGSRRRAISVFEHDARNRLVRARDPLGNVTSWRVDDRDLVVGHIDPTGHRTSLEHDGMGALVRRSRPFGTPPALSSQSWERDALGRIIRQTESLGATTVYEPSPFGVPARVVHPDGSIHSRTFERGQVVSESRPDGTRYGYAYDGAGRLALVTFVPGAGVDATPPLRFSYDGLGRLVREEGAQILERSYDDEGRVVLERQGGRDVHTAFDDINGLMDLQYPDGRRDRHRFDLLGRLISVEMLALGTAGLTGALVPGDVLLSLTYEGAGRLHDRMTGNGCRTRYGYDQAGRLEGVAHFDPGGAVIAATDYVLDGAGRRRVVLSRPLPGQTVFHQYDELGRLVASHAGVAAPPPPRRVASQAELDAYIASIDLSGATLLYRFIVSVDDDRIGWVRRGKDPAAYSAGYDLGHRIVTLEERDRSGTVLHAFEYTGANRTGGAGWSFTYDALDQLTKVRAADGTLVLQQEFDASGRSVRRQWRGGRVENLAYSGATLVQVGDDSGRVLAQLASGAFLDDLVVVSAATGSRWLHLDGGKSLVASTNEGGTVVERYEYDPFGMPAAFADDGATPRPLDRAGLPPLFAGRPLLPAIGLYDFRARIYDPATGHFLQPDPVGVDGPSPYVYAGHDPVNRADPFGTIAETVWDVASIGIGAASLYYNWSEGNYGSALIDAVGLALDGTAAAIPFVPGGAGAVISGLRATKWAVTAAEAGAKGYQASKTIRGLQAGVQVVDAYRGAAEAQQSYRQGDEGLAAAQLALSMFGVRGAFGKAAEALQPRFLDELYTVQGHVSSITGSRSIWGMTEGAVYAARRADLPWYITGLGESDIPSALHRGVIKFTGEAARQFERHEVLGAFSGWKAVAGQYKSGFGDLALLDVPFKGTWGTAFGQNISGYAVEVADAVTRPGSFAGQSADMARLRQLTRRLIIDPLSNAAVSGILGAHSFAGEHGLNLASQALAGLVPTDAAANKK